MKRLVIVRHAKTEQGGYDHDFNRQLTEKGRDDAHQIAQDLMKRKITPDYIIASPAVRALTTARIFSEELGFPKEKIIEKKGLYFDYTTQDLIDLLHEVSDGISTIFVFGHNPFMSFFSTNMSKNFEGDMPTCSTVVLEFNVTRWEDVDAKQGDLILHLYPKIYNL